MICPCSSSVFLIQIRLFAVTAVLVDNIVANVPC